jgi:WD40 repeat protein
MPADPKQAYVARELDAGAPLMVCRFDPTGRFVFATGEDRNIYRWDLASGKRIELAGHDSWIGDLAFTADGQTLISAGYDDTLIWWPAAEETPQPIRKVKAHEGWIRSIALSPDGQMLASGGSDRFVRLWNAADGSAITDVTQHERDVYSVLWHAGTGALLSGDLMGLIHAWEIASRVKIRTFDATSLHKYEAGQAVHYGGVRGMTFSPDGKWLVAGGLYKATNPLGNVQEPLAVRFDWETTKFVRNHITDGNANNTIWAIQYHPQGFVIGCIGGGKGQLAFWNEGDEKPFHSFNLPNSARGMSLHPDNLQVATTHHDRKLRITRLEPKPAA